MMSELTNRERFESRDKRAARTLSQFDLLHRSIQNRLSIRAFNREPSRKFAETVSSDEQKDQGIDCSDARRFSDGLWPVHDDLFAWVEAYNEQLSGVLAPHVFAENEFDILRGRECLGLSHAELASGPQQVSRRLRK